MGSLASPSVVRKIVNSYGFRFKKSLGQNFLTDQNIINHICSAAELKNTDFVVEIGPGIGSLTEELAQLAGQVLAVEIDQNLIEILEENLSEQSNVNIINNDILKINLDEEVATVNENFGQGVESYKVVANLPYYITTPVIMYLLENKFNISEIVVMIQKEVADRIVAKTGGKDYGTLTLAINYYTMAELAFRVPNTVFIPKPEVDSAVIRLKRLPKPPVHVKNEKLLFKTIKAAFGQRRKTLLNALSNGLALEKERVRQALSQAGLDAKLRGENLTLEDFARLSDNLD